LQGWFDWEKSSRPWHFFVCPSSICKIVFCISNMFCFCLMLIFPITGNIRCKPDVSRKIRAWTWDI
jgi:hypothetical protein